MKIKITYRPRYNPWLKKYLNTKTFSKILAFGILLNSVPINSFASILSEDGRYETFEGDNITINDILEEDEVDVEIEGNTLVNIFNPKDIIKVNGVEINKDKITVKNINGIDYIDMFNKNKSMIKPNTAYTVFVNVFENNIPENDINNEKQPNGLIISSRTDGYGEDVFYSDNPNTQYRNFKIEPGETGLFKTILHSKSDIESPEYFLRMFVCDKTFNRNTKVSFNVMIIEGNHIDKDIDYFEGMKSVGQDDENGHSIEIMSTNSNKTQFNKTKISLSEPLRGLPNGVKDRIVKRNGQWVVERNCVELNFRDYPNIKFTKGGETTEKQMVTYTSWNYLKDIGLPLGKSNGNSRSLATDIICSNLSVIKQVNLRIVDGISAHLSGFNISMSREKYATVDDIKKWLIDNNISIIYQRAQTIYEPLNIDSTVNTYLDTTYISTNSTIPATLRVMVDRAINKAVEYTELAKISPTVENLSRARMWVNLLKESDKKDELQEEITDITNIDDMVLDRKLATSNLDVYIKSENMLSMSLDTNQISFDDFSGIEDVEKVNAVNISINSSLPYQLNAYLPAEIQNSDKTKTLDKSILNIKENSESAYQTFANTTDKIVLKDNCSAGNYLVHGVDLKLTGGIAHEKDVYKAIIKLEAEQK